MVLHRYPSAFFSNGHCTDGRIALKFCIVMKHPLCCFRQIKMAGSGQLTELAFERAPDSAACFTLLSTKRLQDCKTFEKLSTPMNIPKFPNERSLLAAKGLMLRSDASTGRKGQIPVSMKPDAQNL